jgi:hypothetical protein
MITKPDFHNPKMDHVIADFLFDRIRIKLRTGPWIHRLSPNPVMAIMIVFALFL